MKKYYEKHPERVKASSKRYYDLHKKKRKEPVPKDRQDGTDGRNEGREEHD